MLGWPGAGRHTDRDREEDGDTHTDTKPEVEKTHRKQTSMKSGVGIYVTMT